MTDVYGYLVDSSNRALQRQTVKCRLVAPGNPFLSDGLRSAVIQVATVSTDQNGRFEVSLIPNSEYEQLGTYYDIDARDGLRNQDARWSIQVPDAPGEHNFRDLIIVPPDPGEPNPPVPVHYLQDHADVDGTTDSPPNMVLKKGDDGIWRPSSSGGGGDMRGDAFFLRAVNPSNPASYEHNDVWVNYADDYSIYQLEAS